MSHEGQWPKTIWCCPICGTAKSYVFGCPCAPAMPVPVEVVPVQRGAEDTEAISLLREAMRWLAPGVDEPLTRAVMHGKIGALLARLDTTRGSNDA